MKRKVLIVSFNFYAPESLDGVNKILFNILKDNPYYEVEFMYLYKDTYPETDKKNFKSLKASCLGYSTEHNSRVGKIIPWIFGIMPLISMNKGLAKDVANKINSISDEYDVIHFGHLSFGACFNYLSNKSIEKTLLMAVDSYSLYMKRRVVREKNIFKKLLLMWEYLLGKKFEKKSYSLCPKVLYVSEVDKKFSLENFNKGNFFNIPLGVDTKYFLPKPREKRPNSLIFTGNFGYGPNKDAALFLIREIMPKLAKVKPDIHLVLAGSNPDQELLSLGNKNITVTGFVDDLRPFLWESALYVCPLGYGAGMKNKLLEAFSLNMVVLCSAISIEGIGCISGKHCLVIQNQNPHDWVNKILEILNNQESYCSMGNEARAFVEEKYSWVNTRKEFGTLYNQYPRTT